MGPAPLHPLTPTHTEAAESLRRIPERCVSGVVLSAIRWVEGYRRLRRLVIKERPVLSGVAVGQLRWKARVCGVLSVTLVLGSGSIFFFFLLLHHLLRATDRSQRGQPGQQAGRVSARPRGAPSLLGRASSCSPSGNGFPSPPPESLPPCSSPHRTLLPGISLLPDSNHLI